MRWRGPIWEARLDFRRWLHFADTQSIGAAWLKARGSALLRVPSALVPETANVLFHPLHPDAASFEIERSYEYPFELRLKD
jgi:RES domain-containing protein